jgi:uncharacterized protein YegL
MYSRRLPVYLLLDSSESMAGPAIEAITQAVETLVKELVAKPESAETAYLSVITFSRVANQVTPLTDLMRFQTPKLSVRPGTGLGAALRLLLDCIQREVVTTSETIKGDYKPLVFLLTDGQPTDRWEEDAALVKQSCASGRINLIAVGCGPDVDFGVLSKITDVVLKMPKLMPDTIHKSFVWISSSIKMASARLDRTEGVNPLRDSPPPGDAIEIVDSRGAFGDSKSAPRQVFIQVRCSRGRSAKLTFIVRFVRRDYEDTYSAVAAHPLEWDDEDDERVLQQQTINASFLSGWADCPYCQNPFFSRCPVCKKMICRPKSFDYIYCPNCEAQLCLAPGGQEEFEISIEEA